MPVVEGTLLPASVRGKKNRVYRQPVGVVGVISPWNFPIYLSNRLVAPALALGNAVVLKPASETPVTGALLLARIYEEAGLPPGVLDVVVGSGRGVGDAFVDHPHPARALVHRQHACRPPHRRARRARRQEGLPRAGGNTPFIVLDDADSDRAVDAAVTGKFMHQGQICMAINRILVDESRYDDFRERFVRRVAGLKARDPVGRIRRSDRSSTISSSSGSRRRRGRRPAAQRAVRLANDTEYGLRAASSARTSSAPPAWPSASTPA